MFVAKYLLKAVIIVTTIFMISTNLKKDNNPPNSSGNCDTVSGDWVLISKGESNFSNDAKLTPAIENNIEIPNQNNLHANDAKPTTVIEIPNDLPANNEDELHSMFHYNPCDEAQVTGSFEQLTISPNVQSHDAQTDNSHDENAINELYAREYDEFIADIPYTLDNNSLKVKESTETDSDTYTADQIASPSNDTDTTVESVPFDFSSFIVIEKPNASKQPNESFVIVDKNDPSWELYNKIQVFKEEKRKKHFDSIYSALYSFISLKNFRWQDFTKHFGYFLKLNENQLLEVKSIVTSNFTNLKHCSYAFHCTNTKDLFYLLLKLHSEKNPYIQKIPNQFYKGLIEFVDRIISEQKLIKNSINNITDRNLCLETCYFKALLRFSTKENFTTEDYYFFGFDTWTVEQLNFFDAKILRYMIYNNFKSKKPSQIAIPNLPEYNNNPFLKLFIFFHMKSKSFNLKFYKMIMNSIDYFIHKKRESLN